MISELEADLYCRMTLKQYGLGGYRIVWKDWKSRQLGAANPWGKEIELSNKCRKHLGLLSLICKHEIAHVLQHSRMGGTYKVNGRNNFHGKVFKQICKEIGIPSHTEIPACYL